MNIKNIVEHVTNWKLFLKFNGPSRTTQWTKFIINQIRSWSFLSDPQCSSSKKQQQYPLYYDSSSGSSCSGSSCCFLFLLNFSLNFVVDWLCCCWFYFCCWYIYFLFNFKWFVLKYIELKLCWTDFAICFCFLMPSPDVVCAKVAVCFIFFLYIFCYPKHSLPF